MPLVLLASALALIPSGAAGARTGRARTLRFRVSYTGSGSWATTYHSTPPNQGGDPDTNDGHDSSTQRWSIRFEQVLRVPICPAGAPCPAVVLDGAKGGELVTGQVYHHHVDGLYAFDDYTEKCRVSSTAPAGRRLAVQLTARRGRRRRQLALQVSDPLSDALLLLASQCPGQGDSLDGFPDEMFGPGFSFAAGWGPDPWLRSAPVAVRLSQLRSRRRTVLDLGPSAQGTPPAGCAVLHPSYERCRTGGSWSGRLTLTRLP